MAVLTPEDFENFKRDMDDTGDALNTMGVIEPRYGEAFYSLPLAIQKVIEAGGFEPFLTEALLLASTPTVSKKAALAFDTENLHFWNGSVWVVAGSISINSAVMQSSLAAYDPALKYKGKATPQTAVPASPQEKDCYLVSATGTVFGVLAEQGQLLIRTTSGWRLGELNEVYGRQLKGTESGGLAPLAVAYNFSISGHISSSGVFTSSGYKTTYFKPVKGGQTLSFLSAGSSAVSVLSFYDSNFNFISPILGNGTTSIRTVVVPSNAAYVRLSNNPTLVTLPYCNAVISSVIDSTGVVKQIDFTVEVSLNLARPEYIINDFYVNDTGTVSAGAGWKYIKIPVVAGKTYTFGGFGITTAGYFSVLNAASNTTLLYGGYQTGTLPKTITIPEGGAWLAFDICRPNTDPSLYAQLRAYEGEVLLDYVEPVDTIVRIKGLKLAGTAGGGGPLPENVVVQGGDAILGDIYADSFTVAAFYSNLPLANDPDLQIGQFYEDENGFVKVKR